METSVLRSLIWMGSAKRDPQAFPTGAQKMLGDELQLIQFGGMPKDVKPFHGVDSGVLEIAVSYDTDAFRTVLAVQLGSTIYVLHAFQKKSKTGRKTPQQDVDLIKRRYRDAQELAKHANEKKFAVIEYEEGSGNVFADLGLEEAEELLIRAQLGFHVYTLLKGRKLKQREIALLLGIAQPDVSHLMNGQYSRFTTDKLLEFLRRLDRKVSIQISQHHPGEPYQKVSFAA